MEKFEIETKCRNCEGVIVINDRTYQVMRKEIEELQKPIKDRWQRFVTTYSAIKRAERMDANDIYERSQEAAHYNWLDEENEKLETKVDKLEAEKKKLVEALEFYSNSYNFYGEARECDLDTDPDGGITQRFGTKAREVLAKIKSEGRDE